MSLKLFYIHSTNKTGRNTVKTRKDRFYVIERVNQTFSLYVHRKYPSLTAHKIRIHHKSNINASLPRNPFITHPIKIPLIKLLVTTRPLTIISFKHLFIITFNYYTTLLRLSLWMRYIIMLLSLRVTLHFITHEWGV